MGDSIAAVAGDRHPPPAAGVAADDRDALAGRPADHGGLHREVRLIDAAVRGGYTWLGIVIVIGSMISLAYYLRVIAAVWMRPAPDTGAEVVADARAPGARRAPTRPPATQDWEVTPWRCSPAPRPSSSGSSPRRC